MITGVLMPILLLAFYISLAGYILTAILDTKKVRDRLENIWYSINVSKENVNTQAKLNTVRLMIQSVYMKGDKVSHAKLVRIALVMNTFAAVALILITIADPDLEIRDDMEEFSYPLLILLGFIGVYVNEYIAIRLFLLNYRNSIESDSLRPLATSFLKIGLWLIIILPLAMIFLGHALAPIFGLPSADMNVYMIAPTQLLAIVTVLMSLSIDHARYLGLIALPAAVSIYLPLGITVLGLLALKSTRALDFFSSTIDSNIFDYTKVLKLFFFGAVSVIGSTISVIAYDISRQGFG